MIVANDIANVLNGVKLSVITINYNNCAGLEKTLASIFGQTFKDFEYIVIDGGSTDGSVELLERYREKFSHCISEPDRGIYHAMNKGVQLAQGNYLLFLNSGDWLFDSNSLDNFFLVPPVDDIIYANLNVVGPENTFIKTYPSHLDFEYMVRDTLPHPATLIKRNLFEKVGLYDENLKIVSDWKFFIVALFTYNATYKHLDFVCSSYDYTGVSADQKNAHLIQAERYRVYWEFFPLHKLDSSEAILNRVRRKSRKSRVLRFFWAIGLLRWLRDI